MCTQIPEIEIRPVSYWEMTFTVKTRWYGSASIANMLDRLLRENKIAHSVTVPAYQLGTPDGPPDFFHVAIEFDCSEDAELASPLIEKWLKKYSL